MPTKHALLALLPFVAGAAGAEPVPLLTPAQMEVATRVFVGEAQCDQKQSVHVRPAEGRPGYFEVLHRKARYLLAPEETKTGAVRLEDRRSGMVWLQIPAKSMLLDTAKGSRLVDGCTLLEQRFDILDARDAWVRLTVGDFGIAALGR